MNHQPQLPPLFTSLLHRIQCNLGLKLLLLLTVPTTATAIYFMIQRHIVFPTWQVPATFPDRMIPFRPHWVWIYLSLYVMCPIGPIFTRSRETLIRYAMGVSFYSIVGFICFILFPIAAPRPAIVHGDWLYYHLVCCDRVYNSVPSLHAACGIFAVLYAAYASRDTNRPRLRIFLLGVAWGWFALILYSTIATRQHYALDLPPGLLLGWLSLRVAMKMPVSFAAMPVKPSDGLQEPSIL